MFRFLPRAMMALTLLLGLGGCGLPLATAAPPTFGGYTPSRFSGTYPLDDLDREVPARGRLDCPDVETVVYRGDLLRYQKAVRVHPEFRERLRRFEAVAIEVAEEIYGRKPVRVQHLGAMNCRRIKRPGGGVTRLSEHAFGNALDVAGFDFGPAPRKAPHTATLPPALRRAFHVRVDRHWSPRENTRTAEVDARHSLFLRELRDRLAQRDDIFRRIIGPPRAGHDDHFHFDNGPPLWRWGWSG